jgi:hypothetical protein
MWGHTTSLFQVAFGLPAILASLDKVQMKRERGQDLADWIKWHEDRGIPWDVILCEKADEAPELKTASAEKEGESPNNGDEGQ